MGIDIHRIGEKTVVWPQTALETPDAHDRGSLARTNLQPAHAGCMTTDVSGGALWP